MLNRTPNLPNILLMKLSYSATFSKFLKDYLSMGTHYKTLLKSREMMFIGSAWSAKPAGLSNATDCLPSVPSIPGADALGERKSPSFPTLDSVLEPRMWPVWE